MKNQQKDTEPRRRMADYTSVGLMFPVSMVVGFFIGYGLDTLFHISPILTIVFTLYGVAAGFINLFKVARRHDK